MGRRVSVDSSRTNPGNRGSEGHRDSPASQCASEEPSGEAQSFFRTAPLPHKQWPATSESRPRLVTNGSSAFCSASASSSSFELDHQATSRDMRSPSRSSQIDRFDSTAKSLFSSTGRALRRHANKLSFASSISFDKDEEGRVLWYLTGLGASVADDESIHSSSARKETLKRAISAPFGFKHVTHTYQEQVRGLERASRNELISEFSAIRAGQRADPQLRGIKAEDLPTKETPSSPGQNESKPHPSAPSANIALPIPASHNQSETFSTGPSTTSQLQHPRAVGNFSRPASRTSLSPITPPKRISSLNACSPGVGASEAALDASVHVHGARTYPQQTLRPAMSPASLLVGFNLPEQDGNISAIGHAISTTDKTARHLKASPLPVLPIDLDDVPEDEEGFVHCESRTSPVGNYNGSLPLRHVQSFPSSRHDAVQSGDLDSHSSKIQRHTTSLDAGHTRLGLEDRETKWLIPPSHVPRRNTKRFSIGLKPMCETQDWEQDVDYCYEHAAEAESDFDWDHQVANFPVGLQPSPFESCDNPDNPESPTCQLQQLAGIGLHDRKHDSQESSVLSVASSIIDISRSTNSVGSLPELDYSVNSSRESMDWEAGHGSKRSSKPARHSQPTATPKSPKSTRGLGLSYSLFPSNTTPPRTP